MHAFNTDDYAIIAAVTQTFVAYCKQPTDICSFFVQLTNNKVYCVVYAGL